MFTITKDFHLSYSHKLDGLPEGHQCARLHGHNAVVRVTLASDVLSRAGFVLDYGDLTPLKEWLDTNFDHRHLNEVIDFPPSAELLARHVYFFCIGEGWPIVEAGWSETPKTWATYREGN